MERELFIFIFALIFTIADWALSLYIIVTWFIQRKTIKDLECENDELRDDILFYKGAIQGIRDQQRRSSAQHETENAKAGKKSSDTDNYGKE